MIQERNLVKTSNKILLAIDQTELSSYDLISILELTADKLNIDTVSGMAEKENKTPRGIRTSNCYRKITIGRAKLAVKGVRDIYEFPF